MLFAHVIRPGESFSLSICNPPFHASAEEAAAGTRRKNKNLHGASPKAESSHALNFGGRANELWYPGGEVAFIRQMIAESCARPGLCLWFTTLVSKHASLAPLERQLRNARVRDLRVIPMFAGQKQSRLLAWSFLPQEVRRKKLSSAASAPPAQ
jgi:23S rRNA (adenine1618-N6)-methyltransferase